MLFWSRRTMWHKGVFDEGSRWPAEKSWLNPHLCQTFRENKLRRMKKLKRQYFYIWSVPLIVIFFKHKLLNWRKVGNGNMQNILNLFKSVASQLKLLHSWGVIVLLPTGFVCSFIWWQWYRLLQLSSVLCSCAFYVDLYIVFKSWWFTSF